MMWEETTCVCEMLCVYLEFRITLLSRLSIRRFVNLFANDGGVYQDERCDVRILGPCERNEGRFAVSEH